MHKKTTRDLEYSSSFLTLHSIALLFSHIILFHILSSLSKSQHVVLHDTAVVTHTHTSSSSSFFFFVLECCNESCNKASLTISRHQSKCYFLSWIAWRSLNTVMLYTVFCFVMQSLHTLYNMVDKRTLRWCNCHQPWNDLLQGRTVPANKKEEQMIKRSCSPYLPISLNLSLLHTQPLQMFGLLYATLQQNDCTRYCFLVTLWPWVKVMIIQTCIKLYSLVMSSVIASLKPICS